MERGPFFMGGISTLLLSGLPLYGKVVSEHHHRTKMERMLRGLGSYTPDEFARECARMSVTAEATVLNEPEFDRYR